MRPNNNQNENELKEILQEVNRTIQTEEMPRRVELCRKALGMVSRKDNPMLWGKLHADLATSLAATPTGNKTDNFEQAIEHYKQALEVITRQNDPEKWVVIQFNLGVVYTKRQAGDNRANLEYAAACFQNVLSVSKEKDFPDQWNTSQQLLRNIQNTLAGDSTTDAPPPRPKPK